MSDLRKAAEMALEFIVLSSKDRAWFTEKEFEVVATLRQALAQSEEKMRIEGSGKLTTKPYPDGYESERDFRKALAQPEQGHCVCGHPEALGVVHFRTRPCFHYTAPPKRDWVGLTGEEICSWFQENTALTNEAAMRITRAIEAKLKEKNGG